MFKKCLKYDFRAFGKIWLLAAAVVLAIAILGSVGLGSFAFSFAEMVAITPEATPDLWFFTQLFIGLLSLFAIFSSAVVFILGTELAICLRYYNHLFTDQGYLTFTLPVKRSTLFWSKTVSGYTFMIGSIVMYGVAFIATALGVGGGVLIAAFKALMQEYGMTFFELVRMILTDLFTELTLRMIWDGIIYVIEKIGAINILRAAFVGILVLLYGLASTFTSLMLSYSCITLGATMFRKLKLLSVLITYYIVNNVLMIPFIYISTYYGMFASAIGAVALPKLFENVHIGMSVVYLGLIVAILATLCVGVSLAIFNLTRIERKLNLA